MTAALAAAVLAPSVLAVGDGKPFSRIEGALAVAKAGDVIEVHPSESGYAQTALRIRMPRIRIVGKGPERVVIDGSGFDYSGSGSVPRAIVQVDPGADGVRIEHLELRGAHNASHNGAGIRINGADNVSVVDCDIHSNDMGVMSNGVEQDPTAASDQLFEACRIHENGSLEEPGYNHNLYLGGTSAKLKACEVWGSLTGHNLKSRAHFTLVVDSYLHDSANREADIVESWDTERRDSHAVFVNTVIVKDPRCAGNSGVVHFGQEKGRRDGTLWMLGCTVVTPFSSPIVSLTSSSASARLDNCAFVVEGEGRPQLAEAANGALRANVFGEGNWIDRHVSFEGTGLSPALQAAWTRPPTGDVLDPATFGLLSLAPGAKPVDTYYLDGQGKQVRIKPDDLRIGARWNPPAIWSSGSSQRS
ncbi:MAG: hypothetical protein JST30_15390 [Armatimonadetes bacterium]|nr:hypothetical protein [Armatimonadota bacterium]